MKNRTFKKLPADKRQNILIRILRNKTDGLLYIKEEVALPSVGTRKKQFQIRIPVTRRCKKQCVREKCICEYLVESIGHCSICCGLQLVQA